MTEYVDYAWWQVSAATLAGMGFAGAMRYLGGSPSKDLTAAERDDLRAHGLAIGLVCEGVANRAGQGFGAGHDDAAHYNAQADSLGYPRTCTLFYAVDFDASAGQVQPYFDGIGSIAGRPYAPYGSAKVVDGVRYPAPFGWQTVAWSSGAVSKRAGLLQHGFHNTYDTNTLLVPNFGQWFATGPTPPPPHRWTEEEPMSYPERIPADGKSYSVPVPPPHAGGCQGGYGNVWLSVSYDDAGTGTVNDTIPARIVAVKFDGSVVGVFGGDAENVAVPRTRIAAALADGVASVSIVNKGPGPAISVMVEAETRGVPAG